MPQATLIYHKTLKTRRDHELKPWHLSKDVHFQNFYQISRGQRVICSHRKVWFEYIELLGSKVSQCMTITLTHWGRVTHICVSKLTIIASDNDLLPGRRQAIIWTSAGILLIGPLGTNFSEIWIAIITFSFKKMCLKVSSAKWQPCCLDLNVLKIIIHFLYYPPADLLKLSGIYFFPYN